ncbi:MAG: ribonucleotide-diphosphate reductase subunit beta [Rhodoferax sp.]|uniref:ribonucleotide-diphosphate reductase subunit beta n=1 Tax=Rhodoferax sp. TaxID=50421 RepID=UPI00263955EF|nr:ribonucleotide-diphosphate reductase subunit beta [Rhodoferax sp.]MDD2879725.1 ribonucleotide-diphosphate reductase subunit beta [Rhodoferax sp.]
MTSSTHITNRRRIAFGAKDELMNMSRTKYQWATEIYDRMEANTWFPKSIPLGDDRVMYRSGALNERERNAFDKALAFVSNLDGIQFNNLIHNIGQHITAPEVSLAIARQASEEGVHVRSYQFMIEAVSLDPESVYMMFERDGMLAKKNEFIMRSSSVLKDDPTPENFARAIVGNVILEGIYFYSAFLVFYTLARNGKMLASADMIKYINRDEGETHLDLFTNMHHAFKAENPELYDEQFRKDAIELIKTAVDMEVAWGQYIIQGGFLGLTNDVVENFVKGLANKRALALNLGEIYANVQNAVPWFDDFSKPNGTRSNFFESKPTDYATDGLEW